MGAVGAGAAAPLPKILPVKLPFRACLPIAFGDVDLAHETHVRFRPGGLDSPVNFAVFVEGFTNGFHPGWNPLHRAYACGSSFFNGIFTARRHPKRRMGLLYERDAQVDVFTLEVAALEAE